MNVDKGPMKHGGRRGLQIQNATNHGHVGCDAGRLQGPAPRRGGSGDTGSLITRVPKKRFGALHKNSKERFKLRAYSKACRVLPGVNAPPFQREPSEEFKPGRPLVVLGIGARYESHALPEYHKLQL